MRTVLVTGTLILLSGAVLAQQRPSTVEMTCADAKALVTQKSAVVLSTGGRTFDRYFATRLFCSVLDAEAVPRPVPTVDNPSCRIGYVCQARTDDD